MAKKKGINKTTKEHFAYYTGQITRWLNFFGIQDWRVYMYHSKIGGALASFNLDYFGKILSVTLSTEWDYQITKKLLSKCAFHEVAEIMVDPCKRMMHGDLDDKYEAIHTVVRRLENIVFEPEWARNGGE